MKKMTKEEIREFNSNKESRILNPIHQESW